MDTINLPEKTTRSGRSTIFHVYNFDDGSKGLAFQRNTVGGKERTLSLLTRDNLDLLCRIEGRTILYLHWNTDPRKYFTAENIRFLENLREYRDRRKIWVTSSQRLLSQAYAYSYLKYHVKENPDYITVAIEGFDDPIQGLVPATVGQLANLSFRFASGKQVVFEVNDSPIPSARIRLDADHEQLIATITER